MFDDAASTSTWSVVRRALIFLIPLAAVVALLIPLMTLDLDEAGVPDGAGPGWHQLRDWSTAARHGDQTEAADLERQLAEIRDNTGRRFLTALDDDQCWTLNADNPTPLPTLDELEVCAAATPVDAVAFAGGPPGSGQRPNLELAKAIGRDIQVAATLERSPYTVEILTAAAAEASFAPGDSANVTDPFDGTIQVSVSGDLSCVRAVGDYTVQPEVTPGAC